MINEASKTFFRPNLSEKEPAGYEMSAAARLNRAYIKIVVSKGAPISCVRKIKNELLELPRPKRAITERYFQYPLGYCRREITSQRNTFPSLEPIGKCARETLHNVLRSLGKTLYRPNDTAARFQGLSQKYRQNRVEHFRRGISKETRRGEQKRVA